MDISDEKDIDISNDTSNDSNWQPAIDDDTDISYDNSEHTENKHKVTVEDVNEDEEEEEDKIKDAEEPKTNRPANLRSNPTKNSNIYNEDFVFLQTPFNTAMVSLSGHTHWSTKVE